MCWENVVQTLSWTKLSIKTIHSTPWTIQSFTVSVFQLSQLMWLLRSKFVFDWESCSNTCYMFLLFFLLLYMKAFLLFIFVRDYYIGLCFWEIRTLFMYSIFIFYCTLWVTNKYYFLRYYLDEVNNQSLEF